METHFKIEDKTVDRREISVIASTMAIKPPKLKKAQRLHSFQCLKDNFDCFASVYEVLCEKHSCAWCGDCLPLSLRKEH
jgi:hypothetical protein